MKNHRLIVFAGLCLVTLSLITCKKPADLVFNGNARIRGTVYFTNYLTGRVDTAKTTLITLTQTGNSGNPYTLPLTNGTFDIQSLSAGNYQFNFLFYYKQPGATKTDRYTGTVPVTLSDGQFLDNYVFTMTLDSTSTPTLQVTLTDQNGIALSNAQVCLYADPSVLAANRGTCSGSIASVTTNVNGIALFSNLQIKNYYISANASFAGITYTNQANDQKPIAITQSTKLNSTPIVLAPLGYSLQILLKDISGSVLANANVCLYTDTSLLAKYRGLCAGSIKSGVTNSLGQVLFTGLQNVTYFASAYRVSGSDTLSNKLSDVTTKINLAPTGLTIDSIVLLKNVKPAPTILKFLVTDINLANLANANVCLYSDTTLLAKYRGKGTGSLFSGVTDATGSVSFAGLQNINYYVSAYKVVGSDTLSNRTTDTKTKLSVIVNQVKTISVIVKK